MARPIVLVHGAWHGSWCWARLVPLLDDAGVDVTAVDLPSRGNAAGTLADDAAHVRAVLDGSGGDVVLVGHSYGGAVITEGGAHPAVGDLVYLAAFALDKGESCMAAAMEEAAAAGVSHEGRPQPAVISGPDGLTTFEPASAAECLYNTCDDETTAWALSRLVGQPMATLNGAPSVVAWREKPATYAVCTSDMIVHPHLQQLLAKRCSSSVEWPTDHSPFLCRPDLVAELLVNLATR